MGEREGWRDWKELWGLFVIINPCHPLFSIITNILLHHYWDGYTLGTTYSSTDNTPTATQRRYNMHHSRFVASPDFPCFFNLSHWNFRWHQIKRIYDECNVMSNLQNLFPTVEKAILHYQPSFSHVFQPYNCSITLPCLYVPSSHLVISSMMHGIYYQAQGWFVFDSPSTGPMLGFLATGLSEG